MTQRAAILGPSISIEEVARELLELLEAQETLWMTQTRDEASGKMYQSANPQSPEWKQANKDQDSLREAVESARSNVEALREKYKDQLNRLRYLRAMKATPGPSDT